MDALHQESETQQLRLAELEALTEQSRMLHQEFAFHQEMIESFASAVDSATLEENAAYCAPSSKRWSGTAKTPMFTSLQRMERRICHPLTNLCIRWERIANEILMHFRAQRKLQGEVSLSEAIETDKAGNALYLQDVVGADDTMQEDLEGREDQRLIRRLVGECLTDREADVIRRRYGLDGHPPQTQRQVAAAYGISRSYVSRIEKRALEKLETALREHCYP
ncbi:MAG: sigma-70 family RNA polymerase sigma factor [Oscillospiraceae bacterium]